MSDPNSSPSSRISQPDSPLHEENTDDSDVEIPPQPVSTKIESRRHSRRRRKKRPQLTPPPPDDESSDQGNDGNNGAEDDEEDNNSQSDAHYDEPQHERRKSRSSKRRSKEPSRKIIKRKKRRDVHEKKVTGLTYEFVDEEDFISDSTANAIPPANTGPDDSPQKSASEGGNPQQHEKPAPKPAVLHSINVVSKMHGEKKDASANSHVVYVEDGLKGRFKKMQYSQLLKARMEKTIQQQQQDPQVELSTQDRREQVRLAYHELYFHLAATVLNIFSFCRGLLAGVCLMHLALTYFSNFNNFVVHFLQWYSPVSALLLKVYMILIQISLVGAAFEVYFKLIAPFSASSGNGAINPRISVPQRVALILQFVVFLLVFYFTLGISSLDDYFTYQQSQNSQWYNDSTYLSSAEFLSRLIPWHILNALRSILILMAYVVSFLSNREQSAHLQAQFKQQDAYAAHHHGMQKDAIM